MKNLDRYIKRIPIFLFLTVVLFNMTFMHTDIELYLYKNILYIVNELIGASLISNIVLLILCFRLRLCYYNKVATFGLLGLNVVNFIFLLIPIGWEIYYNLVLQAIMIPVAILAIILFFRKV